MLSISNYLLFASLLLVLSAIVIRGMARRDYLQKGRLSPLTSAVQSAIPFLWGIFTWIDLPPGWPSPQNGAVLTGFALTLIVLGLGSMFVTMAAFGFRRAIGRQSDVLKQSGAYAWSRNPQTLFCGVGVIGYALLWPSWHTAGWVLLYFAMTHMLILTEEEHLRKQHGEEYESYCRRVPRYLRAPTLLGNASVSP
jgi:protein-S-isoprenylcysteine O-methyltransferase Ste14